MTTELNAHSNADQEALYKAMVDRFLGWKLPKDFGPDAGISFNPTKPYEGDEFGNSWWPVGTNLLTADQALAMFKHCLPADLIAPEASHCSDERPCIPCFTDNGACDDKPAELADTRAEFEAWVRSVPFFAYDDGPGDTIVRDNYDGGYIDAAIHAAWLAWNAQGAA